MSDFYSETKDEQKIEKSNFIYKLKFFCRQWQIFTALNLQNQ